MSYDPMNPFSTTTMPMYNQQPLPFSYVNHQVQQGNDDILKINGIESAYAYPTKPNSRYVLFDENCDVFYIKQTDASNFPTITKYRFEKAEEERKNEKYVTMEEFEKFKEEILNGKQHIRSNNKARWNGNERNSANKGNDADAQGEQ